MLIWYKLEWQKKRVLGCVQSIDNKTRIRRKREREKTKKNCTHLHRSYVSDKSLFCARLIFKNNDNESERNLFCFSKNVSRKKRKEKKHEHKITCNEEMLLIHVCV